jgi:hypothetical protein
MDLIFTGKQGRTPSRGSVERLVLEACADPRAWPRLKRLEPGDFEWAIGRLRKMGWGFEWVTLQ